MATFEITGVEDDPRSWEAKKGPAAGQKFLSYSVQAKGPDGQTANYEISRRPESQPPALGPDEYTVEPPPWDGALPKLKKSGGNFTAPKYERVPDKGDDQRWSIERQVAAKCAAEVVRGMNLALAEQAIPRLVDIFHTAIHKQDLDADVGGGSTQAIHDAPPVAADVSAGNMGATPGVQDAMAEAGKREASPAQKGKLTQLFGKANLSRDAMKAVVLFRCRSEKATKDGASKLIQDLMDGATHDTLLAEIHDAKRAGDPLAIRAAKLIPSDVPLAEDPEEKAKEYEDESGVPF